jgi:hypothetical protein
MSTDDIAKKREMPEGLAKIYEGIHQEASWLHAKWKIFRQLFGASEEQIDLLNRTAPGFFVIIEDVLLDEIVLSFGRLTDPLTTGQGPRTRENLSLARLVESLKVTEPLEFCESIGASVSALHEHCKVFRDWRNRRIAHTDLPTALKYHPDPLPGISRKMIEDALQMISRLLNRVLGHFENVETGYDDVTIRGDGETIIFYLQQAEEYDLKSRG